MNKAPQKFSGLLAFVFGCTSCVFAVWFLASQPTSIEIAQEGYEKRRSLPLDKNPLLGLGKEKHVAIYTTFCFGDEVVLRTGFYRGRKGIVLGYDDEIGYTVELFGPFPIARDGDLFSANRTIKICGVLDSDLELVPSKTEVK